MKNLPDLMAFEEVASQRLGPDTTTEKTFIRDSSSDAVEVLCGTYRMKLDREEVVASQAFVGMDVFHSALVAEGRFSSAVTAGVFREQVANAPKSNILYQGIKVIAAGPYVIPMQIDGVQIFTPVMVPLDGDLANTIALGKKELKPYIAAIGSNQDMSWEDDNSSLSGTSLSSVSNTSLFLDQTSRMRVLLRWTQSPSSETHEVHSDLLVDTGASHNVMNRKVWEELGKPPLQPYGRQIFGVDCKQIMIYGETSTIDLHLAGLDYAISAKFIVMEAPGKGHVILGRGTMIQSQMAIDLHKRRIRMPRDQGQVANISTFSQISLKSKPVRIMSDTQIGPKEVKVVRLVTDSQWKNSLVQISPKGSGNPKCWLGRTVVAVQDEGVVWGVFTNPTDKAVMLKQYK